MGRKPRIHYPGAFYHALNRGNQRQAIFRSEADFQFFQHLLALAHQRYGVRWHGFCQMTNHYHLLAEVAEVPLSTVMRALDSGYARYFNRKYHQQGHVFQGRYRGILCEKHRYLLELVRYIHLNPVRAHLVEQASLWPYSSLKAYGSGQAPDWLYTEEVLTLFGSRSPDQLRQFLSQAPDISAGQIYQPERFPLLGGPEFRNHAVTRAEPNRVLPRPFVGPKLSLREISQRLGQGYGFKVEQLVGGGKAEHRRTELRGWLVYAASEYFYYRTSQLARFLRTTPAAITYVKQQARAKIQRQPKLELQLAQLLAKEY